jgi:hypothetical protein
MVKLSICIPVYDDFDGLYFTVQSLRMFHPEVFRDRTCEFVVVDNNPESPHGKQAGDWLKAWVSPNVATKYIPDRENVGAANAKDRACREASGEIVLCMDSHVMLTPGSLGKLLDWYDRNPDSLDLVSGPLIYDDLKSLSTHFNDEWRGQMWGTWGTDQRGVHESQEPFDIPGNGCGLFSCRRKAWLGFNPHFRQFGGEEMYIHEKFRRAGRRCLCLPFLRWMHRFGRPSGVPYPNHIYTKLRNYVIGHWELNTPLDRLREHYVPEYVSQEWWNYLLEDPIGRVDPPGAPQTDLESLYKEACDTPSDINEHCPRLRELASLCTVVVELGTRKGISTAALLAGQPGRLVTCDLHRDPIIDVLQKNRGRTDFVFRHGDSTAIEPEACDLLFIDTKHTSAQVSAELVRHGGASRRWIAFHDTATFGKVGEDHGPGLLDGIYRWMKDRPEWSILSEEQNNNGLMVIQRR